jgi:putative membrane protein
LSSTSSTEQNPKTRSATEILASRYRHLFALPSYPTLLVYGGIASFAISLLSRGESGIISFVPAFAVLILSAMAISSALRIVDKNTIATFRRAQALLLAADLLWLLIAAIGAAYALSSGSSNPLTNAILFGAFVCAGFEFLVIQGAFEKKTSLSLGLAALHPASTLLVIRLPELTNHFDVIAVLAGIVALALIVAFPLLLRRRRTSLGYDTLSLFQAFMKTWTAGNADELERIISDHAEEIEVTTKVLRFRTKAGDIFLVLPGVHPGPFHPVGSYDLPGVISRSFKELGPVMTLHRPGGHERNLATRAETSRYVLGVSELARSIEPDDRRALLRGPVHGKVGKASVSASAFDNDLVMTVSFAPLGSDDIDTRVEDDLTRFASETGFDLSLVDAHNSIDPNLESAAASDSGWKQLFETTGNARAERFNVAYSHSSEVGFVGRGDLTENGIALLMVQRQNTKSALILADANNSVPNLRNAVERALAASGCELFEFCTSDSHNLAARGLTVERGYEALGEATPPQSIAELAAKLAKLSESRLAPAEYGSARAKSRVRVFGSKALEEFAAITQSTTRFSRNYFRIAGVAAVVLLLISLFF